MSNRVSIKQYSGNNQYGGLSSGNNMYCFGCKQHRSPANGKMTGKLRLFKCAECLSRNKDPNQQTKEQT